MENGTDYAFPNGERVQRGMTLRDYFAARAILAFVDFGCFSDDEYFDNAAMAAYKTADAMLEERNK